MINRREFMSSAAAGAAGLIAGTDSHGLGTAGYRSDSSPGWSQLPSVLRRIQAPVFPKRVFSVAKFGASGDGEKDCTSAFREAIAACSAAGGGTVLVPKGVWLTGPLHLKSNINLQI